MACNITIDNPIGVVTDGVLTGITVTGTATNCRSVSVQIFCLSESVQQTGVLVDTTTDPGKWIVTFDAATIKSCECAGKIAVIVKCDDGKETCENKGDFELKCDPLDGECPSINLASLDIGDCNPDGTSSVTISYQLNSASSYTAELRDSSGIVLDAVSGANLQTLTGTGNYGGNEIFSVVVTSPSGCAGQSLPLTLPTCTACPSVSFGYDIGACDEDGSRNLVVEATITPITTDPYSVDLRDGLGNVLTQQSGTGELVLTHTQVVAGGTSLSFRVVFTDPAICGDSTVEIDIPPCECPEIELFHVVGEECDDEGRRSVTVTATLTSAVSYEAELRDSSGNILDQVSGSGSQTLEHTDSYAGGSTQTFSVVINSPAGCDGAQRDISVPNCGTDDDSDESSGCGGLRLLVAIAAALAILAALLALCVPPAATALWIVAAVAAAIALIGGIVYAIFCPNKPCRVALLISGQSTLAAGVVAIVLSACCPWLLWAGLALVLAGLGALFTWQRRCNKSLCALAKEITKIIGGVILPVLGVLAAIPLIGACLSGVALAWVSAVFGPIAAYASTCSG